MKNYPYIKEYKNIPVPGIEIMNEQSSFMMSKMMDIEDEIHITYSLNPDDLKIYNMVENTLPINNNKLLYYDVKKMYSYDNLKQKYITLSEDNEQKTNDKNFNTSWVFNINTTGLLKEYLYHELYVYNKSNEFFNITNDNYIISDLVKSYIEHNILKKYRFKTFKLYVKYFPLSDNKVSAISSIDNDVQLLSKKPEFDIKAIPNNLNEIEIVSIKPYLDGVFNIYYKQLKSSNLFTFIYYYDIIYEKI